MRSNLREPLVNANATDSSQQLPFSAEDSLSSNGSDMMTRISDLEGVQAAGARQRVRPHGSIRAGSGRQNRTGSAGIVFTLWNTMMGSTLLVMPNIFWQSGWVMCTLVSVIVASLATHTAGLVLHHAEGLMADESAELGDLAALHFGKTAKWITFITGSGVLIGAATAMHCYARTVLEHLVEYGPEQGGLCFAAGHEDADGEGPCAAALGKYANWVYTLSVLPITVPLANLPTIRLLARIGGVGIFCFLTILAFAFTSAFVSAAEHGVQGTDPAEYWRPESASIAFGIFSMSFFIHNAHITIMRGAAQPHKNQRNLATAFFLVWICYASMGVASNLFPPGGDFAALGSDDAANGLISLAQPKAMAPFLVLARIAVLVQAITVYPVLLFIIRAQLFSAVYFKKPYPGWMPVLLFSLTLATISSTVALAGIPISVILKFVGSAGGFVCVFCIPALVHAAVHWKNGTFSLLRLLQVSLICGFGTYALVVQLVPGASGGEPGSGPEPGSGSWASVTIN
jgi:sodium-coupled neutral amino acid transporter 9